MREDFFPSTWGTETERFCALFPNRYGYIYKPLTGGNWLSADERWKLSDSQILKAIACAHQKFFIGTRSGRASRFAVLDIDAGSKYHSLAQVNRIRSVFAQAGIHSLVPYRSSQSGGWHLYIYFDQAISSRDLHKQISLLLQLNKFSVQRGQLEIFPNPGQASSLGFGLRLPMQPGWAWLDPLTMEIQADREELTAFEALDLFLFDLENSNNSQHDFHRLKRYVEDNPAANGNELPKQERNYRQKKDNVVSIRPRSLPAADPESIAVAGAVFGEMPPGILADVWLKGRQYFDNGLSGPGQRAEAIFSLSHYLFYGDPESKIPALGYGNEDERQILIEQILAAKHNRHSDDINAGRADALAQIRRAANWRPQARQEGVHKPYQVEVPIAWILENERRKNNARARIQQAANELRDAGLKLSKSALREKAKCSWTTLYKHQDLWQSPEPAVALEQNSLPEYEEIASAIFESDFSTHEYNDLLFSEIPVFDPLLPDPDSSSDSVCSSVLSLAAAGSPDAFVSASVQQEEGSGWLRVLVVLLLAVSFLHRPALQNWSNNYLRSRRKKRLLFEALGIYPKGLFSFAGPGYWTVQSSRTNVSEHPVLLE